MTTGVLVMTGEGPMTRASAKLLAVPVPKRRRFAIIYMYFGREMCVEGNEANGPLTAEEVLLKYIETKSCTYEWLINFMSHQYTRPGDIRCNGRVAIVRAR